MMRNVADAAAKGLPRIQFSMNSRLVGPGMTEDMLNLLSSTQTRARNNALRAIIGGMGFESMTCQNVKTTHGPRLDVQVVDNWTECVGA